LRAVPATLKKNPEMVAAAIKLRGKSRRKKLSLRDVATELAKQGYRNGAGNSSARRP
jgi:hypothetical protein